MSEDLEGSPRWEDERVDRRITAARPEVDGYVRDVMRARALAGLFGAATATAIRVGRYELRRHLGTGGGGTVFEAWDPELAREVALKLVTAADPELRARALAEGQILARLAHPNVVAVFDVGVVGDRIYLVMELVRGGSLRAFAADARPREIVAAYRQCADGLAAAHAARLVHRDFKPDNAIMGEDGRARVIDFGLALDNTGDVDAHATPGGTPRYMAPEQQRGGAVTAAADQYALAAAMREALAPVPAWLDRVLARALAEDPADRFASMAALGAALGRDPATQWRRRALVAIPVVLGLAGYAAGLAREDGPAPCSGGSAELAAAWTPARRGAVVAHLTALGTPYAQIGAERLSAAVDGYAARWIAQHRAGCLAHRRGALSAEMYDRRQVCLASARTQLGAVLELGAGVGATQIDALMRALPELPDLARCDDLEALTQVPPPAQAQLADATALQARLDRARVRIRGGADDVEPELAAIVRDARALGYPPLLGGALLAQGTSYLQRWKFAEAEGPLRDAQAEALRSRDYAGAVEAFARLAWVMAKRPDRPPLAALDGLAVISPLADGLPPQGRFAQSLLHNNVGSIAIAGGDAARARAEFEAALALARDVTGPGAIELSAALQGMALITEDPARRAALFDRRSALLQRELGDVHPLTLSTQIAAALTREAPAQALAALAAPCQRTAELHPSRGAAIGECAFEHGSLALQLERRDEARASFALAARAGEPDSFFRAAATAYLAAISGEAATAERQFADLLRDVHADASTSWHIRFDLARLELGLGLALDAGGRPAAARQALGRARAHLDAALAIHRWAPMAWRVAWLDRLAR